MAGRSRTSLPETCRVVDKESRRVSSMSKVLVTPKSKRELRTKGGDGDKGGEDYLGDRPIDL